MITSPPALRSLTLLLCVLGQCFVTAPASAELADPTVGFKLELGYQSSPSPTSYTRLELSYLITDAWILHSSLMSHLPQETTLIGSAGLRYQLDVFHYVPWVGLHVSAPLNIKVESSQLSAGPEFGLDRRLTREHAVSLQLRLPQLSRADAQWSLGVSWRYDWLIFDPFTDLTQ